MTFTLDEYLRAYEKYPLYIKEEDKTEEDKYNTDVIRIYNKELCELYPWLIPINQFSGKRITDCGEDGEDGFFPGSPKTRVDYNYEYTELDNMPIGWRRAFGEQMCKEINDELIKFNYKDKYSICQIKEKYSSLRWYDNGTPVGTYKEEYDVIEIDYSYKFDYDKYYYKYVGKNDSEGNQLTVYHRHELIEKCIIPEIISKYEKMSEITCIDCGSPAKWQSTGWISPYCTKCKNKINSNKEYKDSFVRIKSMSLFNRVMKKIKNIF